MQHRLVSCLRSFFVLLALLLTVAVNLHASTFNRVAEVNEEVAFNNLVVGEKLYFYQNSDFWVSDGTEQGTVLLADGALPLFGFSNIRTETITNVGNLVYTILSTASGPELWVSDGTPEGTRQAFDFDFGETGSFDALASVNNQILLINSQQNLVVSNGTLEGSTVLSNITFSETGLFRQFTTCTISDDSFYILVTALSTPSRLFLVRGNTATEFADSSLSFFITFFDRLGDHCFIDVRDNENGNARQLLRLDSEMNGTQIDVPGDTSLLIDDAVFGDRLLISRTATDPFTPMEIFSLQGDSTTPELLISSADFTDVEDEFPDFFDNSTLIDFHVTEDNLFLAFNAPFQTKTHSVPTFTRGLALDQNLEIIASYDPRVDTIQPDNQPQIFTLGSDSFLFFDRGRARVERQMGRRFEFDVNAPMIEIFDLIGSRRSDSQAIYALGRDLTRNFQVNLYRFQQTPGFSERHSGLWTNPQLQNQGLIIKAGVDASQRQFLFAALFSYEDGAPSWLAGNTFYQSNEHSLQFDLFRFTDLNFLDLTENMPANSTQVGQIKLDSIGCNQIRMTLDLESPFGQRELLLDRLVDQSFNNVCSD